VTEWISSLEVIHANHSVQQESDSEQKIQGTCGPISQTAFDFYAPESASLKTSKDISASDSEKLLESWKALVTKRRGEYSQRVKLARLTSESASSSWPTVTANEDSYRIGGDSQQIKCLSAMARRGEMSGPPAPENPSTHGSRQESWATATVSTGAHRQKDGSMTPKLDEQVKQWATPTARDFKSGRGNQAREYKELTPMVERTSLGKLNPRWVEMLMGLPVGWVMPSCVFPATIEPMNCASSATESCLPQRNSLSELCLPS